MRAIRKARGLLASWLWRIVSPPGTAGRCSECGTCGRYAEKTRRLTRQRDEMAWRWRRDLAARERSEALWRAAQRALGPARAATVLQRVEWPAPVPRRPFVQLRQGDAQQSQRAPFKD